VLGPDKIVCTFEDSSCSLDDDLEGKERWIVTKSAVNEWDNTLNVGVYQADVDTNKQPMGTETQLASHTQQTRSE